MPKNPARTPAAASPAKKRPPGPPKSEARKSPAALPAVAIVEDDVRGPDDDEMDVIVGWITEGLTEFRIRQRIAGRFANLSPREALGAAMLRVADNLNAPPGVVMAWTFEAARAVYRELYKAGEYADALKALKFVNEVASKMAAGSPDVQSESAETPDPAGR